MHLDESLYERESDAEPTMSPARDAIELGKQVENAGQQLGRDTDPIVTNADLDFRARLCGSESDTTAPIRVLGGVAQHVTERLRETGGITEHREHTGRHIDRQDVSVLLK